MKKHVFGRQFKRDTNERKALFKGLMNELVLRERIQTTEEKAKAIRGRKVKPITTLEESMNSVRIVAAEKESVRKGQKVAIR